MLVGQFGEVAHISFRYEQFFDAFGDFVFVHVRQVEIKMNNTSRFFSQRGYGIP
jgi:hypothetical protein